MAEENKTEENKPSFFQKIKQWLGIGGVKAELVVDPNLAWDDNEIKGQVIVTTKSEQKVEGLTVYFQDLYSYKSGDTRKYKTYKLGEKTFNESFTIDVGESKTIDFVLPFAFAMSKDDKLKAQGGVMGALGTAGSLLNSTSDVYTLYATVNVEGTALGSTVSQKMKVAAKK